MDNWIANNEKEWRGKPRNTDKIDAISKYVLVCYYQAVPQIIKILKKYQWQLLIKKGKHEDEKNIEKSTM